MRLSDWDIRLEIVGQDSFEDSKVAECIYSTRNMYATIRLLDPKQNHNKAYGFQNIEATIYHELLHIIITPYISNNVNIDQHEQIVERIAKALAKI